MGIGSNRSIDNRYTILTGRKTVRLDESRPRITLTRRALLLGGGGALTLSAAAGAFAGYRLALRSATGGSATGGSAAEASAAATSDAPSMQPRSQSVTQSVPQSANQPAANPPSNSASNSASAQSGHAAAVEPAPQAIAPGGPPELPALGVIALNRMAFGPRPGDLEAFRSLGQNERERLQAYVEQQLAPGSIDDSECDAIVGSFPMPTLTKTLEQLWEDHFYDARTRAHPVKETEHATLVRAVHSKRQLVEVLADHWHNHFNVSGHHPRVAPIFVHYDRDVIRPHLLGNFRAMLEAVAQSPAMLYFLDNQSNTGGRPNENYARELLELHTLGAESYLGVRAADDPAIFDAAGQRLGFIDADVPAVAACLMGWRVKRGGEFEFSDEGRSLDTKTLLGHTIAGGRGIQEGRDVLDILATHPGTARHVCHKLCRRLIADDPPERIVHEAAGVFLANTEASDQLKQVVRTILLSPEFGETWGQKVKRPFEYVVSILRATEADFAPNFVFRREYHQLGQRLFGWETPDGYPDFKEAWCGAMSVMRRWQHAHFLMGWRVGGDGPDGKRLRLPIEERMPAEFTTAQQIVDFWIERVLGRTMPDAERLPLVEFMAGEHDFGAALPAEAIAERLRPMIALLAMSPSFQWR